MVNRSLYKAQQQRLGHSAWMLRHQLWSTRVPMARQAGEVGVFSSLRASRTTCLVTNRKKWSNGMVKIQWACWMNFSWFSTMSVMWIESNTNLSTLNGKFRWESDCCLDPSSSLVHHRRKICSNQFPFLRWFPRILCYNNNQSQAEVTNRSNKFRRAQWIPANLIVNHRRRCTLPSR